MARIEPVPLERMTAAQRRLHDRVARVGRRAGSGPWVALLHAPEVGEPIAGFVEHFMSETRLPQKLKEVAILVIARAYCAQYEWFVHERRARRFDVEEAVIEGIRNRVRPKFQDPDEALVHDIASELSNKRRLSEPLYERAIRSLGEAATVELVALIGFYAAVAVLCESFKVDAPDGASPPLPQDA
jgi:4-carboxymuconolactone decarboxylase